MTDYGHSLEDLADSKQDTIELLGNFLNKGVLGLFLGAGASMALDLPGWNDLVERCYVDTFPGEVISLSSSEDNKKYTDKIKKHINNTKAYLDLIKKHLYNGVSFDFSLAKKDLLIALTSLIVNSKTRGNINTILTLNFDSVLEWYLKVNGLRYNILTPNNLFKRFVDVDIIHLHGYLPRNINEGIGSDYVIMSKKEFEDWNRQPTFRREIMENFFRERIFVSVGLSVYSYLDDLNMHFRALDEWYIKEKIARKQPFGFAFLTECSTEQKTELLEHGVVPLVYSRDEIPGALFSIAQKASL